MTSFSYNAAAAITANPALPSGMVMLQGTMRNAAGYGLTTSANDSGFLAAHNATYTGDVLRSKITMGTDAQVPEDIIQVVFIVRSGSNAGCIVGLHIMGDAVTVKSETAAEVQTPLGSATLSDSLKADQTVEVTYDKTTGLITLAIDDTDIPITDLTPSFTYAAEASLSPGFGKWTSGGGNGYIAALEFGEDTDEESDTTPNAFSFTDETGVTLNTTRTSNNITIGGIDAPADFTVSGAGSAQVNSTGSWVTSGTVQNGDQIRVRHTSSSSYSTAVNTTLTVGGVSDTFTSTTLAEITGSPGLAVSDIYAPNSDELVEDVEGAEIMVFDDFGGDLIHSGTVDIEDGSFVLDESELGEIDDTVFVVVRWTVTNGEEEDELTYAGTETIVDLEA